MKSYLQQNFTKTSKLFGPVSTNLNLKQNCIRSTNAAMRRTSYIRLEYSFQLYIRRSNRSVLKISIVEHSTEIMPYWSD